MELHVAENFIILFGVVKQHVRFLDIKLERFQLLLPFG